MVSQNTPIQNKFTKQKRDARIKLPENNKFGSVNY